MHNDRHQPFWYLIEYVDFPQGPLSVFLPYRLFPSEILETLDLFNYLHSFVFSKIPYTRNPTVCSLHIGIFLFNSMCLSFPNVFSCISSLLIFTALYSIIQFTDLFSY